jgi:hypothetical protein
MDVSSSASAIGESTSNRQALAKPVAPEVRVTTRRGGGGDCAVADLSAYFEETSVRQRALGDWCEIEKKAFDIERLAGQNLMRSV